MFKLRDSAVYIDEDHSVGNGILCRVVSVRFTRTIFDYIDMDGKDHHSEDTISGTYYALQITEGPRQGEILTDVSPAELLKER